MASRDKQPSKPSSSRTGGICTLSDLNHPSADSYGPQEYYTGGEKSGMLIQDPSKANGVDAIFNQARQLGAVEWPVEQLCPSSSSSNFTGTGETVQTAPQQPENVVHNIVFWSNGFTVNDGPLRSLDDPENAAFLETIRKSECPRELEPADRRSSVHVNLIRSVNLIRRNDNCPEPERHHVPGSWNFVINSVSSGTNDQMDMEDSMVEDTVQASTPIAPIFGQPPVSPPQSGFVFGSATLPAANPFQFAQQSSGTPQNLSPFQATNNLGGSFSVGAGDKSGRKIVRVNRNKSRKK